MKKKEIMKYIIGKHTILGLLAVALVLLTGCQADSADSGGTAPRKISLEMQTYATTYKDAQQSASTRADGVIWNPNPPSGFTIYNDSDQIRISVTKDNNIVADGNFVYSPTDKKWFSTFEVKELKNGPYYLYGYMPEQGVNSSLTAKDGDFSTGATLILNGLPTATSSDICVIVGVKKGEETDVSGIYSDNGIKMGSFSYDFTGVVGDKNHVFLLCDHLYARLHLSVTVDEVYNALRTIKLKKVWVRACKKSDGSDIRSKSKATVPLRTTDGASPIYDFSFTNVGTSAVMDTLSHSMLYKSAVAVGDSLSTTPTLVDGYLAGLDLGITEFILVTKYDVYDKNVTREHPHGNLVRQDQYAENKINISKIFGDGVTPKPMLRGTKYTLNLKVNPTYLYMLSEPDLDNPTVEIVP